MTEQPVPVVIAVVDALRHDYVTESTAPHLCSLMDEGVSFDRAFAAINATDPSLTSLYTGNYPRTTGLLNHGSNVTSPERAAVDEATFLQERLQDRGYESGAVDWLGRWHRRGFDYYSGALADRDTSGHGGGGGAGQVADLTSALIDRVPPRLFARVRNALHAVRRPTVEAGNWLPDDAEAVVDAGLEWLDGTDGPPYLFLHFWDAHGPYEVPEEYAERFGSVDDPEARYRGGIAFVDDQLARLDAALADRGMDDRLLVVLGDHGESFGEHGIYFDHHGLYDQSLHVPLVMSHPSLPTGRRVDGMVQHVDVAPTVLDLLGVDPPSGMDGRSLVPVARGDAPGRDAVVAEEAQTQRCACIRTDRYKYIAALEEDVVCRGCRVIHGDREELYDLSEDPGETRNVVEKSPAVADRLGGALRAWIREHGDERSAVRRAVAGLVSEGTLPATGT